MINFGATPSSFASSITRVFPAISASPLDHFRSPLPLAQEPAQPKDPLGGYHGRGSERLGPAAPTQTLRETCIPPAQVRAASSDPLPRVRLHMPVRRSNDPEELGPGADTATAETGTDG